MGAAGPVSLEIVLPETIYSNSIRYRQPNSSNALGQQDRAYRLACFRDSGPEIIVKDRSSDGDPVLLLLDVEAGHQACSTHIKLSGSDNGWRYRDGAERTHPLFAASLARA